MANSEARHKSDDVRVREALAEGAVIPAHPLALDASRKLDERRQRALSRYYIAAGAGGLAVGVHTTQFGIHNPKVGLLKPVWTLAAEEMDRGDAARNVPLIRVAGICGKLEQAVAEAQAARDLRFQFGLLSLGALRGLSIPQLLDHCRAVAEIIPLFGFYLQPKVGGVELPHAFWRGFCAIENVAAIKVAAFDRYRTLDVLRAVAESGRWDIALYTGNDDNIVLDLVTPYRFDGGSGDLRYFVGGLLGQWAVWTSKAVALHRQCRELVKTGENVPADMETQVRQTFDRIGILLKAGGASFANVVIIRSYWVHLTRDLPIFRKVRREYLTEPYPASTAVGTTELAIPGLELEIEAVAVL